MKYYVYLHLRPDDRLPFYVGKGSKNRAWKQHNRNEHWFNTIRKHNGFIVEMVQQEMTEGNAFLLERLQIAISRAYKYPLVNQTDGGDNPPSWKGRNHSHETCDKIAAAHRGKKHTIEHRRNNSLANKGKKKGPQSAATRRKKSEAMKGNQYGRANKGRSHSPEHCAKQSAAMKGRIPWNKGKRGKK